MHFAKNKTAAIAIALLLTISMGASMILLPAANAHTPVWTVQTYAFIAVNPDPIGLGQSAFVTFGIDKVAMTTSGIYGDRWTNFTITVTKPDGTQEKLTGFTADDTGFSYTKYTPTLIGNYTFQLYFGGQTLTGANPPPGGTSLANQVYIGDIYTPSTSEPEVLTVQQEPVSSISWNPLPTGYWSRPINMMNSNWNTIGGDWLGMIDLGNAGRGYNASSNFNAYTTAPNSAHIIWTKAMAPGGLIGGEYGSTANSNYYSTAQYECKFKATVLDGVLYYTSIPGASSYPEGTVAVDIRTGQTLWTKTMNGTLRCGQVYNYISPNQYGGEAYLWSTSGTTYSMYDAMTGNWILDVNGAPSVPAGGIVSQQTDGSPADGSMLAYYTTTVNGQPMLALWNSSLCIQMGPNNNGNPASWSWKPTTGQIDNWSYGIEWTVPLATNISGLAISPALSVSKVCSDVVLMISAPSGNWENYQVEAGYSAITGQQLWIVNRTVTVWTRNTISATANGLYYRYNCEDETFTAYSLSTGDKVWGPSESFNTGFWGYISSYGGEVAYGILYASDYAGYLHAYNATTGAHLWDWWAGPSGLNNVYNSWPIKVVECIADGKVFLNGGHTYNPPLYRGSHLYCINATSGQEIWQILSFAQANSKTCAISDGVLLMPNAYDNQIYAYAPGLSATTVEAPLTAITQGSSLVIRGTVTDQGPGQTCLGIPAKGTPAISDASQEAWMEYQYEQQPKPANATGVPISIDVIDANNNYRNIGTATSDSSGTFSFQWTPDIPGKYTVIATFAGSNSYYASSAETSFAVDPAPATTAAPTAVPQSAADMYFVPAIAGLFVLIIVGLVVLALLMLRKRP